MLPNILIGLKRTSVVGPGDVIQILSLCRSKNDLLDFNYVDNHIEILSHDRDRSNVDLHETFFVFSMLLTKAEESTSKD